jgi:hypothetical protein
MKMKLLVAVIYVAFSSLQGFLLAHTQLQPLIPALSAFILCLALGSVHLWLTFMGCMLPFTGFPLKTGIQGTLAYILLTLFGSIIGACLITAGAIFFTCLAATGQSATCQSLISASLMLGGVGGVIDTGVALAGACFLSSLGTKG